jgi:hypothetical protein
MKSLFTTLAAALALALNAQAEHAVIYGTLAPVKSSNHADRTYYVMKTEQPVNLGVEDTFTGDGTRRLEVTTSKVQIIVQSASEPPPGEAEIAAMTKADIARSWEKYDAAGAAVERFLKTLAGKKVRAEGETFEPQNWNHITPAILEINLGTGGSLVEAAPAATPEIASGIDRSRENAEAENSPYRRLVKAAATECVERYGKKLAGNLKGVQAICAEYYAAPAEDEEAEMGTSPREALDNFYVKRKVSRLAQVPRPKSRRRRCQSKGTN